MILVDFSAVALAGIFQFEEDLKGEDSKVVSLIRHVILTSLQSNKKKFGPTYGDLVILVDGRYYWRKDHFPHYKANRKKSRDASDLNWALIFDTMNQLVADLKENFPYKVIEHPKAEADDMMGVLVPYLLENDLVQEGLVEESRPILILSSDGDNFQLHTDKKVRQWSPNAKKFVGPERSYRHALIDKICMGDAGDGVPNICSVDNSFVDSIRQKPFMKKRLDEFYEKGIDACKDDEERRNYQRNDLMVNYENIPSAIRDEILHTYLTQEVQGNRAKILNYLIKHRCKLLMDSIEDF